MSLDKKSILATEGLPIVNSVFRSDFEDRYSPEVISSEFFRTEDLKNG